MCASYGALWPACGDHSPRATPRQPLRSFYIAERVASSRIFAVIARAFSVALRPSFETRFVFSGALLLSLPALFLCVWSLPALSFRSRLCWVSAQHSSLLCSLLCSLLSSQFSSRFSHISASTTPLALRVAFNIINYMLQSAEQSTYNYMKQSFQSLLVKVCILKNEILLNEII